jgi:hypothetical protein
MAAEARPATGRKPTTTSWIPDYMQVLFVAGTTHPPLRASTERRISSLLARLRWKKWLSGSPKRNSRQCDAVYTGIQATVNFSEGGVALVFVPMKEIINFSEALVTNYQIKWRHIPEYQARNILLLSTSEVFKLLPLISTNGQQFSYLQLDNRLTN